jgi:hypothetical protein
MMTPAELDHMNVIAYMIACDVSLGLEPDPARLDEFRALQDRFLSPLESRTNAVRSTDDT